MKPAGHAELPVICKDMAYFGPKNSTLSTPWLHIESVVMKITQLKTWHGIDRAQLVHFSTIRMESMSLSRVEKEEKEAMSLCDLKPNLIPLPWWNFWGKLRQLAILTTKKKNQF